VHDPALPLDPERDAWTLPLIPRVLARGMPFFAICRGAQETNVALGGTLHQAVQEVPGLADHREPAGEALAVQYAARARGRGGCGRAARAHHRPPALRASTRCTARASSGWRPACASRRSRPTA
jgi:anthranilate/para-aminobenzoate synthase component II